MAEAGSAAVEGGGVADAVVEEATIAVGAREAEGHEVMGLERAEVDVLADVHGLNKAHDKISHDVLVLHDDELAGGAEDPLDAGAEEGRLSGDGGAGELVAQAIDEHVQHIGAGCECTGGVGDMGI